MASSRTEWEGRTATQPAPAPATSSQVLEEPRLGWWARGGAVVGGITGAVC